MSAGSLDRESVAPTGAAAQTAWAGMVERGSVAALSAAAWLYRVAGRWSIRSLATPAAAYFFLTDPLRRRYSLAYLRRVYATPEGRAALLREPRAADVFRNFQAFAISLVDRLGIWLGRTEDYRFETSGEEVFERLRQEGRGAIVVGAHVGSFDALRLLAADQAFTANVVMYTQNAPVVNSVFGELSPEAETRVIPIPGGVSNGVVALRIKACLERRELVAILGDRIEPGDAGRPCEVLLLGDPVKLPRAPFELATMLGVPLILMVALRQGERRYSVHIEELWSGGKLPRRERQVRVQALAEAYASRLEALCARAPFEWFNFYDYWGDDSG